jgi:LysM repeat protein
MRAKSTIYSLVLMLFVAALILSACQLPASRPPAEAVPSATPQGDFPLPGSTDVMSQLEQFATQTAMAMPGGSTGPKEITPTPEPGVTEPAEASATEPPPPAEATATPAPAEEQPAGSQNGDGGQPAAQPVPVLEIPASYTLKPGEHPYCIARRFDVNPDEMLRLSGLARGGVYSAGTVLKIPKTGNPFPGDRSLRNHPANYTVSSGDTIYSVACQFGDVDPLAIAAVNGLKSPYKLTAGDTIKIP